MKRLSREEIAAIEIGNTSITQTLATYLGVMFLVIILFVPLIQGYLDADSSSGFFHPGNFYAALIVDSKGLSADEQIFLPAKSQSFSLSLMKFKPIIGRL